MENSIGYLVEQPEPQALPPLPFTYERTLNPEEATYTEERFSIVKIKGKERTVFSDEKIQETVKRKREGADWFLFEDWRQKGMPQEQLEVTVGENPITIYNYSKEKPFTDEHITRMQNALGQLASRFPQALDKLRFILIDNIVHESLFGDPEQYPLNGQAMAGWRAFGYSPRGMELTPHRIKATSNFEGTFVHEITHLIDDEFEGEWEKKFTWKRCDDFPDEWEVRDTPDGTLKRFFNKQTGEMAPQGQFPLQPDQCVTLYAKQNMGEDICDSMVSYIYNPDQLNAISEDKFNILSSHDKKTTVPQIASRRVPKEEIALPEIKPETIHYYIDETKPE